jgi:general secretion pathway protein G
VLTGLGQAKRPTDALRRACGHGIRVLRGLPVKRAAILVDPATAAAAQVAAEGALIATYEMLNYRKPTTEQGLKALVQMPSSAPKPQRWKKLMESVPLDPWGNEYVYRNPGKFKTDGYDLYSLGPKGEEGEGNIGK